MVSQVDEFMVWVEALTSNAWLQGVLVGGSTFVLEDPTTIACGLLVADGKMLFLTAYTALVFGIALGDLGLYGLGRLAGPRTVGWGLVSPERLNKSRQWFEGNLVMAVLVSRFVPGMRLPTYVGAGILKVSFLGFVTVVIVATVLWTTLLLGLMVGVGRAALPYLGRLKWPIGLGLLTLVVLLQWRQSKRGQRSLTVADGDRQVSPFEYWSPWFFYIPVAFYYTWLALRFRGFLVPTAANPRIYAGGLLGESKSEILSLLAPSHRSWVAPWRVFGIDDPKPPLDRLVDQVQAGLRDRGLEYPLVAKPDKGQRGAGVRPLKGDDDLRRYLDEFPAGNAVILQQLVDEPHEAGIFYYRRPGEEEGHILSLTLKEFPSAIGDGRRSLRELIEADPRARRLKALYLARHRDKVDTVLADGERFPLVFAGNHAQGAVFKDGFHVLTPALARRIHELACALPEFYFGRFDVRFRDWAAFQRGEGFRIVEINGAGAEATHIWDSETRLVDAYGSLFRQFRILFEIGYANRARGAGVLGVRQFLREVILYRRASARYPLAH